MLLPELQAYAVSLGITGTARMRKGQLVEAIQEKNGGGAAAAKAEPPPPRPGPPPAVPGPRPPPRPPRGAGL
ncbi:Rho termination factor N-terminal domain-containing protein [Catenulispora yoronensis]